jgi:hypothetical protein
MPADVLIWSFEHNAWWAPGWSGYVMDAERAGRYSLAEAERICRRANIAEFNEAIVPLSEHGLPAARRPTGATGGWR